MIPLIPRWQVLVTNGSNIQVLCWTNRLTQCLIKKKVSIIGWKITTTSHSRTNCFVRFFWWWWHVVVLVMGRALKVRARAGLGLWKSGSGRARAWALPWMPGLGPWRALKFYYVQQSKSSNFPALPQKSGFGPARAWALLQKSGSGTSKEQGPRAGLRPGPITIWHIFGSKWPTVRAIFLWQILGSVSNETRQRFDMIKNYLKTGHWPDRDVNKELLINIVSTLR